VLEVLRWAEIRRMKEVDGLSIREIAKRTGHDRNTVRRALRREGVPRYRRPPRRSKLDPFKDEIHRRVREDPQIPGKRLREMLEELGFDGSKTIVDDYLREVRPLFETKRTYQRTSYRPGELCQFDLFEPRQEIPVGHGQTRRAWVVSAELGYSRAIAGALVFSKEAPDLLFAMSRCLARLGALPAKLVWGREGAIHAGGGRPTDAFAGFCGELRVGWLILEAADPESKGALERSHRFMRTNFEPGRAFANELDYQLQLDAWCERVNARIHRTLRCRPVDRLALERERMRSLPARPPDADRRFVIRVPRQPYLRFDTNDYSLDPRLAGRRVEVRVSQREITAIALDTDELACRHRRRFARHLTFTDLEVEHRPLARYDALIPA
jgi:transposase